MFAAILPVLGNIGATVAKHFFPDPADELKRKELEASLTRAVMENAVAMEQAAAGIVKAEAQSGGFLASNWRPITMLTFLVLIVARWFGFAAPGLSEEEILKLWDIVQLGLGGYVVGRSFEKVIPSIADALKKS